MRMGRNPLANAYSATPGLQMESTSVAHGHMGLALGLVLASGTSIVLWVGLLQAVRWAAHTFL